MPAVVTEQLQVGRVVGDGNFAVVHVCTERRTGTRLALKVISRERCAGKDELVANEIRLLERVNHEHIVSCVHARAHMFPV
jgi:doublecortin-like kinase 1/2